MCCIEGCTNPTQCYISNKLTKRYIIPYPKNENILTMLAPKWEIARLRSLRYKLYTLSSPVMHYLEKREACFMMFIDFICYTKLQWYF